METNTAFKLTSCCIPAEKQAETGDLHSAKFSASLRGRIEILLVVVGSIHINN